MWVRFWGENGGDVLTGGHAGAEGVWVDVDCGEESLETSKHFKGD